jgi:prevent-host-death family protein
VTTLTIELARAEAELAKLVQQVGGGAEVLITRDGRPAARLVPAAETPPDRVPGSAKGLFTVPEDFSAPLDVDAILSRIRSLWERAPLPPLTDDFLRVTLDEGRP